AGPAAGGNFGGTAADGHFGRLAGQRGTWRYPRRPRRGRIEAKTNSGPATCAPVVTHGDRAVAELKHESISREKLGATVTHGDRAVAELKLVNVRCRRRNSGGYPRRPSRGRIEAGRSPAAARSPTSCYPRLWSRGRIEAGRAP